jgi:hypothetical protein
MGRPKKISDAEAEVIKDAIIDALENNEEVATEEVATEEVATEEVEQEVPLNPETQPVPEVTPAGHSSRDFHSPV